MGQELVYELNDCETVEERQAIIDSINVFEDIEFKELDLSSLRFNKKRFHGCRFVACSLAFASFYCAKLYQPLFLKCGLSYANFSYATLTESEFYSCNLFNLNFSGAEIKTPSFIDSNQEMVTGKKILTFSAGRHKASAVDGVISIGCRDMAAKAWLDSYEQIGKKEGYTDQEIKLYGAFIKLANEFFESIEYMRGQANG